MNQKGEITLISCLLLFFFFTLVLLSALELRHSFGLLEKRTTLFLCAKESKGELNDFLTFMGRTNWGIRHVHKAEVIALFVPGLQGLSFKAEKVKKVLKHSQNIRLISYLKTLKALTNRGCPVDPRMFITPFKMSASLFQRDTEGAVIMKENEWSYGFFSRPWYLELQIKTSEWETIRPTFEYFSEEKGVKLSSHLSLPWP